MGDSRDNHRYQGEVPATKRHFGASGAGHHSYRIGTLDGVEPLPDDNLASDASADVSDGEPVVVGIASPPRP